VNAGFAGKMILKRNYSRCMYIILNKYFRSLMDTLGNNFSDKEFAELEEKTAENGKFYFDKLYKFILG